MADDLFAVSVAVDLDDAGEEGVTGTAGRVWGSGRSVGVGESGVGEECGNGEYYRQSDEKGAGVGR